MDSIATTTAAAAAKTTHGTLANAQHMLVQRFSICV